MWHRAFIELRAEAATLDRIQLAANLVHEQTSDFVRKAAMQRPEDVLRQELVTAMDTTTPHEPPSRAERRARAVIEVQETA